MPITIRYDANPMIAGKAAYDIGSLTEGKRLAAFEMQRARDEEEKQYQRKMQAEAIKRQQDAIAAQLFREQKARYEQQQQAQSDRIANDIRSAYEADVARRNKQEDMQRSFEMQQEGADAAMRRQSALQREAEYRREEQQAKALDMSKADQAKMLKEKANALWFEATNSKDPELTRMAKALAKQSEAGVLSPESFTSALEMEIGKAKAREAFGLKNSVTEKERMKEEAKLKAEEAKIQREALKDHAKALLDAAKAVQEEDPGKAATLREKAISIMEQAAKGPVVPINTIFEKAQAGDSIALQELKARSDAGDPEAIRLAIEYARHIAANRGVATANDSPPTPVDTPSQAAPAVEPEAPVTPIGPERLGPSVIARQPRPLQESEDLGPMKADREEMVAIAEPPKKYRPNPFMLPKDNVAQVPLTVAQKIVAKSKERGGKTHVVSPVKAMEDMEKRLTRDLIVLAEQGDVMALSVLKDRARAGKSAAISALADLGIPIAEVLAKGDD